MQNYLLVITDRKTKLRIYFDQSTGDLAVKEASS